MAGMGTGTPVWFVCPSERRLRGYFRAWRMEAPHHDVVRTGRTKPNPSHRRTQRTLGTMHEFECLTCGRVGWSRIVGILQFPVRSNDETMEGEVVEK